MNDLQLRFQTGGEIQAIHGDNVILSAGAIQSPPILLRSGMAPRTTWQHSVLV